MRSRLEVVCEARTWLGTPFHHQARAKGEACDCAGLVIGVARALGVGGLLARATLVVALRGGGWETEGSGRSDGRSGEVDRCRVCSTARLDVERRGENCSKM